MYFSQEKSYNQPQFNKNESFVGINKEKMEIKKAISDYFNGIFLTKIKYIPSFQTKKSSLSLYYAKIGCMLCIENQYLIVVVENDSNIIGHEEYLENLDWVSFQTRTMDNPPSGLKSQQSSQSKNQKSNLMFEKIFLSEEKEDRNIYLCNNLPIKIELLFTKDDDTYSNNGTVQSALDTYNCVISFII